MPAYEITSPEGKKSVVTAPQGATQDQVLAYAKQNFEQTSTKPQEKGFFGRVGDDLKTRFGQAVEAVGAGEEGNQTKAETGLQILGKTMVGGVNDIVGEGAKSLTPDIAKRWAGGAAKKILNTPLGQAALSAALKGEKFYKEWAAQNPRAARDIEASVNIAAAFPVGKTALSVAESAPSAMKGLLNGMDKKWSSMAASAANKKRLEESTLQLSSKELKNLASPQYTEAEKMIPGQVKDPFLGTRTEMVPQSQLKPSYVAKIFKDLKLEPKSEYQKIAYASDPVNAILSKYEKASAYPMGVEDFEAIDKEMTAKIWEQTDIKGHLSPEGQRVLEAQTKLRDSVYKSVKEGDVIGGKEGFDAYKSAVKTWHDAKIVEDIELVLRTAEVSENKGLAVRRGFEKLYNNQARFKSYPPELQKMIKAGATGSLPADYMRAWASRLVPIGATAMGHPAALAVAPGLSRLARGSLGAYEAAKAQKMIDYVISPYKDQIIKNLSQGLKK